MPILSNSVTNALTRQDGGIHVVIHPQVAVRNDVTDKLLETLHAGLIRGGGGPARPWPHEQGVQLCRATARDRSHRRVRRCDWQSYERTAIHAHDPHCGQQAASVLRVPLRRSAPDCSACTGVADHTAVHSYRHRGSLVEQPIEPALPSRRRHRAQGLARGPAGRVGQQPTHGQR
ncbi:hypothetical protein [Streptomyces sp. NPDC059957]|uniref:hypothetical protein n=1 Tax=unclassified Streptomyces TaxID=2593676 RepID=UPI00364CEB3C